MTPHDNDPLVSCLTELAAELDRENIPVLLGGGLSQYLRGKLGGGRSPRYSFVAPARSTEDLDFSSPRGLSPIPGSALGAFKTSAPVACSCSRSTVVGENAWLDARLNLCRYGSGC